MKFLHFFIFFCKTICLPGPELGFRSTKLGSNPDSDPERCVFSSISYTFRLPVPRCLSQLRWHQINLNFNIANVTKAGKLSFLRVAECHPRCCASFSSSSLSSPFSSFSSPSYAFSFWPSSSFSPPLSWRRRCQNPSLTEAFGWSFSAILSPGFQVFSEGERLLGSPKNMLFLQTTYYPTPM